MYHWKWFSRSSTAQSKLRIICALHWIGHHLRVMPALLLLQFSSDANSFPHARTLQTFYFHINSFKNLLNVINNFGRAFETWEICLVRYIYLHSWIGPFHGQPMRWYLQLVGRSSQSCFSWCSSDLLGYSLAQNWINVQSINKVHLLTDHCFLKCKNPITWHSLGSSLTAFSTAKLRDAVDLEISTRQFGQVATWSRNL